MKLHMNVTVLLMIAAGYAADVDTVSLEAKDGHELTAAYYHAGDPAQRGAVVALTFGPKSQAGFEGLAIALLNSGIDTLIVQLRGYGDPRALKPGGAIEAKYAEVVQGMWIDAAAGADWLIAKGHDEHRIGIAAAGLGCRVAVHACSKTRKLGPVVLVTPRQIGLSEESGELLAKIHRPLLVLSSKPTREVANGVKERATQGVDLAYLQVQMRSFDFASTDEDLLDAQHDARKAARSWFEDHLSAHIEASSYERADGDLSDLEASVSKGTAESEVIDLMGSIDAKANELQIGIRLHRYNSRHKPVVRVTGGGRHRTVRFTEGRGRDRKGGSHHWEAVMPLWKGCEKGITIVAEYMRKSVELELDWPR